jgi:hypothetical protein
MCVDYFDSAGIEAEKCMMRGPSRIVARADLT